jgi:hypothetical protein
MRVIIREKTHNIVFNINKTMFMFIHVCIYIVVIADDKSIDSGYQPSSTTPGRGRERGTPWSDAIYEHGEGDFDDLKNPVVVPHHRHTTPRGHEDSPLGKNQTVRICVLFIILKKKLVNLRCVCVCMCVCVCVCVCLI